MPFDVISINDTMPRVHGDATVTAIPGLLVLETRRGRVQAGSFSTTRRIQQLPMPFDGPLRPSTVRRRHSRSASPPRHPLNVATCLQSRWGEHGDEPKETFDVSSTRATQTASTWSSVSVSMVQATFLTFIFGLAVAMMLLQVSVKSYSVSACANVFGW